MYYRHIFISITMICLMSACDSGGQQTAERSTQYIQELKSKSGLDSTSTIEVLARGFIWSEGPLWLEQTQTLIFSDVPANIVYQWTEADGLSEYLNPSGTSRDITSSNESGANGLALAANGKLTLCQHGSRQVALMSSPLDDPHSVFEPLAAVYDSARFNSPNDLAWHDNGSLYFTDPPYGLNKQDGDPEKELPFNGVYRIDTNGIVSVMVDSLSRPNGIAFSPDHRIAYVAQSDPEKAWWLAYDVDTNGNFQNGRIFYDATAELQHAQGLPDGLKVHDSGTVFATGPGGIWVFSPGGEVLARVHTAQASANCAFDTGFENLYITSDSLLLRVKLSTR